MKKLLLAILLTVSVLYSKAQGYYFPPTNGNQWDTVSPASLGWCADKLDTVYSFLQSKSTKGFIILKGGKIAAEKYFGSFTQDSLWYWASVGKSLTSFLIGVAQQEGKLNINDSVSHYIGSGWTSCTPQQEGKITLKNLLSMTSGLDDGIAPTPQEPNPDDCTRPECLQYKADAGTRWAYHNAAYYMLHNVLDSATGLSPNLYTFQKLRNTTGLTGVWSDHLFISRVRDLARFGLLVLNKGKWNTTTILSDSVYYNAMKNSSQNINPSYGYLWWLNGKSSYKVPGFQLSFNGELIPTAPAEMFAGLGKNDQKLYIVPSMDLVIVRMGEAAGPPLFALSSFDQDLWGLLSQVFCPQGPNTNVQQVQAVGRGISVYPNPATNNITITAQGSYTISVCDVAGKLQLQDIGIDTKVIDISDLDSGVYIITLSKNGISHTLRFVKQ